MSGAALGSRVAQFQDAALGRVLHLEIRFCTNWATAIPAMSRPCPLPSSSARLGGQHRARARGAVQDSYAGPPPATPIEPRTWRPDSASCGSIDVLPTPRTIMAIQTATRPSKRPRAPVDITCPDALLHGNAVQLLVGISATTLRRWVDRGMFPRPMVLSLIHI